MDGTPSLGWGDTLAFLALPLFLVVSQYISMELMQPKSVDPAQQQTNAILKVLPIMIGWFSLSVPSALSVYWVTNNIVTTASTLWIRSTMPVPEPNVGGGSSGGSATMSPPVQSIFTPMREKPAGFGEQQRASVSVSSDGVKPITAMDAEIVNDVVDEDDDDDGEPTRGSETKTKRRKSTKKKRKEIS
jgi:YidC/Oxa1 family membrane protein insertase